MYELFLIVIALLWLTAATISDFKKREIPDWISFSLIAFALSYRAFVSLFAGEWGFFFSGVIGFGIFWALGNGMYRTGFGGGDAKLLMALGAVLPFSFFYLENFKIMAVFLFAFLFLGAGYSFVYSIVIVLTNIKKFRIKLEQRIASHSKLMIIFAAFFTLALILSVFNVMILPIAVLLLLFPILFIYSKAVEDIMITKISSKNLTVGDWLVDKVKIGRQIIMPRTTGLSEHEVWLLRKHHKSVKIKQGIPFTISFLLAFIVIVWLWYSNWGFLNYNLWF